MNLSVEEVGKKVLSSGAGLAFQQPRMEPYLGGATHGAKSPPSRSCYPLMEPAELQRKQTTGSNVRLQNLHKKDSGDEDLLFCREVSRSRKQRGSNGGNTNQIGERLRAGRGRRGDSRKLESRECPCGTLLVQKLVAD